MKTKLLPENIRRRMSKEDRTDLGTPTFGEMAEAMAERSEAELQRQIGALLTIRGIVYLSSRMDKRKTDTAGWPDITCAVNGQAVAIECKIGNAKLSKEQDSIMRLMLANGWDYHIVSSVQHVRDLLNSYITGDQETNEQ